ncbi:hypothetical protein WN943_027151 [Citrus x changshan-huyou]
MAIGFAPVVAYLKSGGSLYMNESLNVKHGIDDVIIVII